LGETGNEKRERETSKKPFVSFFEYSFLDLKYKSCLYALTPLSHKKEVKETGMILSFLTNGQAEKITTLGQQYSKGAV